MKKYEKQQFITDEQYKLMKIIKNKRKELNKERL